MGIPEQAEITTDRLLLRGLAGSDSGKIFSIRSHKEIAEFLDRPLCKSESEALEFINKINSGIRRNENFYWAVTDRISRELMGTICLWNFSDDRSEAEVGFELLPEFQGKGLMSEALDSVIDFCFSRINFEIINADVHMDNQKSVGLLKRYNFVRIPGEDSPPMHKYQLRRK